MFNLVASKIYNDILNTLQEAQNIDRKFNWISDEIIWGMSLL